MKNKTVYIIAVSIGVFFIVFFFGSVLVYKYFIYEPEIEVKEVTINNEAKYNCNKYLQVKLSGKKVYDSYEWSDPVKTNTGYMLTHRYRSEDNYGITHIYTASFVMDKDFNVKDVSIKY